MNKYIIIAIVLVVLLGGGLAFSMNKNTDGCTSSMGTDRDLTVVSKKLEWRFDPEEISVNKCDRVHIKVINEDNFDHGFAIDALGISQRLPASASIDVSFVAVKTGEFPFYCSVSCSTSDNPSFNLKDGKVQSGPYTGKIRGHFDQIGKFVVTEIKKIIN